MLKNQMFEIIYPFKTDDRKGRWDLLLHPSQVGAEMFGLTIPPGCTFVSGLIDKRDGWSILAMIER